MSESDNNNAPESNRPPQETTVIHTAAPATSQSNGNLMMAMVMLMILLIGVAVAFALRGNSDPDKAERERLKRDIAASKGDTTSSLALEGRVATITDNANQILADFSAMKAGYHSYKEKFESAQSELKGNMNTITRISSKVNTLTAENNKLKALVGSAQSYQQQLVSLRKQMAEKDLLMAQLQARPSQESLNSLRSSLTTAQMSKEELSREIQQLKQRMITMVDKSQLDQIRQRLPLLEKENADLRNTIQALRTKLDFNRLFVKSQDLLPAKAKLLYAELQKLEDSNSAQLITAYATIQAELNAENLHQVKFDEGSSLLSFTDQSTIQNKLLATTGTDYFLVVGYASTTGAATANETLSANRATAVASVVNQLKKQGQDVRAVYLGQTNRFSATKVSDNQLCEIWRIRK